MRESRWYLGVPGLLVAFIVSVVLAADELVPSPGTAAEEEKQATPEEKKDEAKKNEAKKDDRGNDDEKLAKGDDSAEKELPAGHSYHGEAFNEGPRQKAYLMSGTGKVHIEVTTSDPQAQKFFDQGVGQLHGFWYFEAERSFRQVAAIDPDCSMAYWGMAMANFENKKRARGFIDKIEERREKASEREKLWIDGYAAFLEKESKDRKKARQDYVRSLEELIHEYPDELEAKAFLVVRLWQFKRDLPIPSHEAVSALIDQIFDVEPMHPAHHYRIHLWDYEKPERAIPSAARCGQSAPAIAHMWHMSGHIYSRLKRYPDACWQQEASARVDHAQMQRDRLLPDQIHNYAHNSEWFIRNLIHIGRAHDAMDLAKNLLELPRHPKYNTYSRGGRSASYGRTRLLQVLERFELWDDLVELSGTVYLEPTSSEREQDRRLRAVGRAHYWRGDEEGSRDQVTRLRARRTKIEAQELVAAEEAAENVRREEEKKQQEKEDKKKDGPEKDTEKKDEAEKNEAEKDTEKKDEAEKDEAEKNEAEKNEAEKNEDGCEGDQKNDEAKNDEPKKDENKDESKGEEKEASENETREKELEEKITKAKERARRPFKSRKNRIREALDELELYAALLASDDERARELLEKAKGIDRLQRARLHQRLGDCERALELTEEAVKEGEQQILPLAARVEILAACEKIEEARQAFDELRALSAQIDLDVPVFQRMAPLVASFGFPEDWRVESRVRDDVGERPDLDALGPFRWSPPPAPPWKLRDGAGKEFALEDYRGKPLVVIFYLGYGCLHCVEQLNIFAPKVEEFTDRGIALVAIGSDKPEDLARAKNDADLEGKFPFPLLSDADLEVFKNYRAHDDFENQPLHGTYLIDGNGLVHWQDISYEPFEEVDFLLGEADRLLGTSKSLEAAQKVQRF